MYRKNILDTVFSNTMLKTVKFPNRKGHLSAEQQLAFKGASSAVI
jgi:hypothetical protein